MTTADRFVDEYIHLCSELCKDADEYTKERVRRHNQAMRQLIALKTEISKEADAAPDVYSVLLNHPDPFIQQCAATDCLELNIHVKQSVRLLKRIARSRNKMRAMPAKRTLLIWKGKKDPSAPF